MKKPKRKSKPASMGTTSNKSTGTITVNYTGLSDVPVVVTGTLEELEKARDVASVRMVYAHQQHRYWNNQMYIRHEAFDRAHSAYMKKKHGLTDEDISREKPTSTAVWSYAE